MRKYSLALLSLVALVGIAAAATVVGLNAVSLPSDGPWTPTGIGIGKALHAEAFGVLPQSGTITVSRVANGITNAVVSFACTNGYNSIPVSGTWYIAAGDTLLRSGGTTNGQVRLILEGD